MGTHYKGKRNEVRALDAYIKVQRVADTLNSKLARRLRPSGLSESQFAVLETLLHIGPLQQNSISQKILKSGGNVTMVIDHLEKRILLRRQVNPEDRRCVVVHLTEAGRKLITGLFPGHVACITSMMSTLTAQEQDTLGSLCRKLGLSAAIVSTETPSD